MRSSGVLMHISSLSSPWGIGTLGEEAKKFIDFLAESSQRYWQVLPVSPTGYGDSPYQSFSSFAGNPYFIDLDMLCEWGLLEKSEYSGINWGSSAECVDFGLLYESRFKVLRKAVQRMFESDCSEFKGFCLSSSFWLDDYAIFMAIKDSHGGTSWAQWERALRFREETALNDARQTLSGEIDFYKALQFLFYRQWNELKGYAAEKGVSIIGDIPIYVAPDSADVWANPSLFMLDDELMPIEVAGCPPDGFTADGQLWGNPLYNWQEHKKVGYSWWVNRINHQFELYDVLRIDHFRGMDEFYSIPFGSANAKHGVWRKGPGMDLFNAIKNALGERRIIAEDLGFLNDSVRKLLSDSGFPGMKVLQFAFDSREDSDYLPHNFTHNCVAYIGTHDNNTIVGWFNSAPAADVNKAREYIRLREGESAARAMLCVLWGSVAQLAIAPMQDLLELDSFARMNTPSTLGGNWQGRMKPNTDLNEISAWLLHITQLYGR